MDFELRMKDELRTEIGTDEDVNEGEVSILSGHSRDAVVRGPKMPCFDECIYPGRLQQLCQQ